MKTLSKFFYSLALLPLVGLISFMSCKKDASRTIAFEATYTTTNEILDPPPMLKQRITGTGKSNKLDISKFVAVSTLNVQQS